MSSSPINKAIARSAAPTHRSPITIYYPYSVVAPHSALPHRGFMLVPLCHLSYSIPMGGATSTTASSPLAATTKPAATITKPVTRSVTRAAVAATTKLGATSKLTAPTKIPTKPAISRFKKQTLTKSAAAQTMLNKQAQTQRFATLRSKNQTSIRRAAAPTLKMRTRTKRAPKKKGPTKSVVASALKKQTQPARSTLWNSITKKQLARFRDLELKRRAVEASAARIKAHEALAAQARKLYMRDLGLAKARERAELAHASTCHAPLLVPPPELHTLQDFLANDASCMTRREDSWPSNDDDDIMSIVDWDFISKQTRLDVDECRKLVTACPRKEPSAEPDSFASQIKHLEHFWQVQQQQTLSKHRFDVYDMQLD